MILAKVQLLLIVQYDSFTAAATSLNLLQDDQEFIDIVQEMTRREIAVLLYWTTYGSVVETINHFADALGNDFHPAIRQNPVLLKRVVQIDIEKHYFDTFHQQLTLFNPLETSLEAEAQQAYNSFKTNTNLDLTQLERMLYPVSESKVFFWKVICRF
jgi:hypothetical protein